MRQLYCNLLLEVSPIDKLHEAFYRTSKLHLVSWPEFRIEVRVSSFFWADCGQTVNGWGRRVSPVDGPGQCYHGPDLPRPLVITAPNIHWS